MKKKQRISMVLALILLLIGVAPVLAVPLQSGKLSFSNPVDLGAPFETIYILKTATSVQNGIPIAATVCSGTPARFNVMNLNTGEIIYDTQVAGGTYWQIISDSKGDIYFGNYNSPLTFYRYSPKKGYVEELGTVSGGTALISLAEGDDGNLYLGTYPNGQIVRYDPNLNAFHNYGRMIENGQYLHAIAQAGNFVYFGEFGPNLYRMNHQTLVREQINPTAIGITAESYQKLYVRGNWLIAMIEGQYNGKTQTVLAFYDLVTGAWNSKVIENVYGQYVSKVRNGKVYYRTNNSNRHIYELDLASLSSKSMGRFSAMGEYIRGEDWAQINDAAFPGLSFVNAQYGGKISIANFETQQVKTYGGIRAYAMDIRDMEFGPDGRLYLSEYMGTTGIAWNLNTGVKSNFTLSQAEGMTAVGNQMVFGCYRLAEPYLLDVTQTPLLSEKLPSIGEDQDRPVVLKEADGLAIMGSVPDYGQLGGALSILDPNTKEVQVFRNLIPEQSVIGLTYRNGIIYGSTSVSGGLNISPTKSKAQVFRFDLATRQLLSSSEPNLSVLSRDVGGISDLSFGPDGLLWGATTGALFAMDPDTLEVKKELKLNEAQPTNYTQYWWPKNMIWDESGLLLFADNGKLKLVDPFTLRYDDTEIPCNRTLIQDQGGDLYFSEYSKAFKIPVTRNRYTAEVLANEGGRIIDGESALIYSGDPFTFTVIPEEYYYIQSVTANGKSIASDVSASLELTVNITENTIIQVVFAPRVDPPMLSAVDQVYTAPGAGGIVFGHIKNGSAQFPIQEYGIVFSKTDSNPEIGKAGCVLYRAKTEKGENGYFGIQLKGRGIVPGETYYAKTYLRYQGVGQEEIQYGKTILFSPQTLSGGWSLLTGYEDSGITAFEYNIP